MSDRELFKKALDSISSLRSQVDSMNCEPTEELAIELEIKARLAQPEPEPVCFAPKNIVEILNRNPPSYCCAVVKDRGDSNRFTLPLYTHPPKRKPLSE